MKKIKKTKSRMIMEIRYPALFAAFDRRGKVLEEMRSEFGNKIEHWKSEGVAVHFADDFDKPSKQMLVDHLRAFIMYEDPGTEGEFKDDAVRMVKVLKKVFPTELNSVDRLGVRYMSIFEIDEITTYNEALALVMRQYFSEKIPISIKPKDCRATFVHENGMLNIGPVKDDEAWVKQTFSNPDKNVPAYGLGIDVDSYASNMELKSESQVAKNVSAVFDLTRATEGEVVDSLMGDKH